MSKIPFEIPIDTWKYGTPVEYIENLVGGIFFEIDYRTVTLEDTIEIKYQSTKEKEGGYIYRSSLSGIGETLYDSQWTKEINSIINNGSVNIVNTLETLKRTDIHTYKRDKKRIFHNDTLVSTLDMEAFAIPLNHHTTLFAQDKDFYHYIGRIFYFSAHYSGKYDFKLIPMTDLSGRPCMFNIVTKKYYYNAGNSSAEFIVGPKIPKPTAKEYTPRGIPDWVWDEGYIPVEYIESKGGSWIDTGYKSYVLKDSFEIKYKASRENDRSGMPYDSYSLNVKNEIQECVYHSLNWDSENMHINQYNKETDKLTQETYKFGNDDLQYHIVKRIKDTIYFDGQVKKYSKIEPEKRVSNTTLFCTYYVFVGSIYYCKIWDENDELVIDYLPVKHTDGRVGMLNLVNRELKVSETNTPFTAGGEIIRKKRPDIFINNEWINRYGTQLEYIQFTGKQYFDTGYYSHIGVDNIKVKFKADEMLNKNYIFHSGILNNTEERVYPYASSGGSIRHRTEYNGENTSFRKYEHNININIFKREGTEVYFEDKFYGELPYQFKALKSTLIGGQNPSDGSTGIPYMVGKIYYFEIHNPETGEQRYYIPLKHNDGRVGLFDLYSRQFLEAKGEEPIAGGKVFTSKRNKKDVLLKRKHKIESKGELIHSWSAKDFDGNLIPDKGTHARQNEGNFDFIGVGMNKSEYVTINDDYFLFDNTSDLQYTNSYLTIDTTNTSKIDLGKSIYMELDCEIVEFNDDKPFFVVDLGSLTSTSCGCSMSINSSQKCFYSNTKFTYNVWTSTINPKPWDFPLNELVINNRVKLGFKFCNDGSKMVIKNYCNGRQYYESDPITVDLDKSWNRFGTYPFHIGRGVASNSQYYSNCKFKFYSFKIFNLDNI